MQWHKICITDLGRVVTGKTPPTSIPECFGTEYPFITPSDIVDGQKAVWAERRLSEIGKERQSSLLLPQGAICVVCIGATIGKICMTDSPSFSNQQINSVIVDSQRHDPHFAFYLLSTLANALRAHAGGAATPIINKSTFAALPIRVPDLASQRSIGRTLAAYDDLIENNTKRIKILEEMARSLYREWFVFFRFPGHEKVKMVDSALGKVPEGWKVTTLGEIADVQWGDTSTTKAAYSPSGYTAYSASGPDGFLPYADYSREGIVLSAIGAQCGKTWYAIGSWSCIKNTMRLWSNDESRASTIFLYWASANPTFWPRRGSAQPFIALGDARSCKIVLPNVKTMAQFTAVAWPNMQHALQLAAANENLRQTRDLLLPRLISGEIDVTRTSTEKLPG